MVSDLKKLFKQRVAFSLRMMGWDAVHFNGLY